MNESTTVSVTKDSGKKRKSSFKTFRCGLPLLSSPVLSAGNIKKRNINYWQFLFPCFVQSVHIVFSFMAISPYIHTQPAVHFLHRFDPPGKKPGRDNEEKISMRGKQPPQAPPPFCRNGKHTECISYIPLLAGNLIHRQYTCDIL